MSSDKKPISIDRKMVDRFFEKFMASEVGRSLLQDIPQNRVEMVTNKLFTSFFNGVDLGMTIAVIQNIDHMSREEKVVVLEYLNEQMDQ